MARWIAVFTCASHMPRRTNLTSFHPVGSAKLLRWLTITGMKQEMANVFGHFQLALCHTSSIVTLAQILLGRWCQLTVELTKCNTLYNCLQVMAARRRAITPRSRYSMDFGNLETTNQKYEFGALLGIILGSRGLIRSVIEEWVGLSAVVCHAGL